MATSKTLSAAQLLVLTAGAERRDRMLLPLPATLRARGGARRSLLASLLTLGLIEEVRTEDPARAWRTDEVGQRIGLRLTNAGLATIGVATTEPAVQASDSNDPAAPEPKAEVAALVEGGVCEDEQAAAIGKEPDIAPPRRPTGKLGEVLQTISTPAGATLAELSALTGWLPHTARAAVTGLRQRGFPIALTKQDGRKAYRLTDAG